MVGSIEEVGEIMAANPSRKLPRIILTVLGVILALAGIWGIANALAANSYNQATASLTQLVQHSAEDDADLNDVTAQANAVHEQFMSVSSYDMILLPQLRDSIATNTKASEELLNLLNDANSANNENQSSDSPSQSQSGETPVNSSQLTAEQRKQVEELLQQNQASTPAQGSMNNPDDDSSSSSSQHTSKPW